MFTLDPQPDFVCGDGAVIYDQGIARQVATRYYDSEGNLTRRVIHEFWSDAQKSDPLTGATAPYTQATTITDVLGIPGDFSSATETVTGQGNITIPGRGAVLLNAGRTVTAPGGSLDFRAGQLAKRVPVIGRPRVGRAPQAAAHASGSRMGGALSE